jgi:hypothetical protein
MTATIAVSGPSSIGRSYHASACGSCYPSRSVHRKSHLLLLLLYCRCTVRRNQFDVAPTHQGQVAYFLRGLSGGQCLSAAAQKQVGGICYSHTRILLGGSLALCWTYTIVYQAAGYC